MNQTELAQALASHVVQVTFVKADGSQRVMQATTQPSLLPVVTVLESEINHKPKDPNLFKVWDMQAQAWRSFRAERVTGWQVVNSHE
jgi:hypothetical protein